MESVDVGALKLGLDTRELKDGIPTIDATTAATERAAEAAKKWNNSQVKAQVDAKNATKTNNENSESIIAQTGHLAGWITVAGGASVALLKLASSGISAYKTAEESQLRLESMLNIVGSAAGRTSEQISALADEMQRATRFDDESIKDAASSILRFGSVTGDSFDRALKLSADLATAMRVDITSAANTVGKALENSYGVTMLRRQGLLTDAQIEYLKALKDTGNEAAYQEALFGALEGKVGGLAEAMGGKGLTGASEQLTNQWGDLLEKLGELLVKVTGAEDKIRDLTGAIIVLNETGAKIQTWQPPKWLVGAANIMSMDAIGSSFLAGSAVTGGIANYQRPPPPPQWASILNPPTTNSWAGDAGQMMAGTQTGPSQEELTKTLKFINEMESGVARLAKAKRTAQEVTDQTVKAFYEEGAAGDFLRAKYATVTEAVVAYVEANSKAEKAAKPAKSATAPREQFSFAEVERTVAAYQKLTDALSGTTSEQKFYNESLETLAKMQAMDVFGMLGPAIEAQRAALEKLNPELLAANKSYDAMIKGVEKETEQLEAAAKKEKEYAKTLGLTKEELLTYTLARHDATIAIKEGYLAIADDEDGQSAYAEQLRKQIQALKDLKQAAQDAYTTDWAAAATASNAKAADAAKEQWLRSMDSISSSLTDALMRGFEDGKDFGKNFIDTLKNWFKSLVLRPVINAIVNPVMGGMSSAFGGGGGGGFGGGGGAGAGGGFDLSSLVSLGNTASSLGSGSLLGMGGISGLFSGSGGIFGAGAIGNSFALSGAGQALGLSAVGLEAAGGVALTTLGSTLGMIVPVVGAALAIAAMFGAFSGGGDPTPKSGGFASAGNISGIRDTDNSGRRWFTPNNQDSQAQSVVDSLAQSFKDTMKLLGGKGEAGFAVGFDSDPDGDAPNRTHVGSWMNGRQVYDAALGDNAGLGRDEATLQKAMTLETKRAFLAAVQASELPKAIADILNQVAAATATEAQVESVLALAGAYKALDDILGRDPMKEVLRGFESIEVAFSRMGTELLDMTGTLDGSVESITRVAGATDAYYSAMVQILGQIESARRQLGVNSQGARETIQLAGADPEQTQALYDTWFRREMENLDKATNPDDIFRSAENARNYAMQNFQSLTPEEQQAQQDDYLRIMDLIDSIATRQLDVAQQSTIDLGQAIITAVRDGLADSASTISTAADTLETTADVTRVAADLMVAAADKMMTTAEMLQTIKVTVSYENAPGAVNG